MEPLDERTTADRGIFVATYSAMVDRTNFRDASKDFSSPKPI